MGHNGAREVRQEELEGVQADREEEEWQMAKGEKDEETGRVRKGNHVKRGRVVQKQKQKWVWLLPRQVLLAWS